jgi:hypothetical protein
MSLSPQDAMEMTHLGWQTDSTDASNNGYSCDEEQNETIHLVPKGAGQPWHSIKRRYRTFASKYHRVTAASPATRSHISKPPYLVPFAVQQSTESSAFHPVGDALVTRSNQPFLTGNTRAFVHVRIAWQIFYDKTIAAENACLSTNQQQRSQGTTRQGTNYNDQIVVL